MYTCTLVFFLDCVLCIDQVQIGFEPQVYNVSENVDSQVTVCASLDRPLQRDGVVVRFFTTDGSAQSKFSIHVYTSHHQLYVITLGLQKL